MKVTAEYLEIDEQRMQLQRPRHHKIQGYVPRHPVDGDAFEALMNQFQQHIQSYDDIVDSAAGTFS